MTSDPYGPLIATEDVRQAALRTLKAWMPEYLSTFEEKHGLPAGDVTRPRSYHAGIDDNSWIGEVLPEVMVLISPLGEPERPEYLQWYLLDAKVMCIGQQLEARAEDEARVQASYLGAAMMLLVQQTGLGGLAQDLVMTSPPAESIPDADHREIVVSTVRFQVLVGSIVTQGGPKGTLPGPEGGEPGPPIGPTYIAEKASIVIEEKAP